MHLLACMGGGVRARCDSVCLSWFLARFFSWGNESLSEACFQAPGSEVRLEHSESVLLFGYQIMASSSRGLMSRCRSFFDQAGPLGASHSQCRTGGSAFSFVVLARMAPGLKRDVRRVYSDPLPLESRLAKFVKTEPTEPVVQPDLHQVPGACSAH